MIANLSAALWHQIFSKLQRLSLGNIPIEMDKGQILLGLYPKSQDMIIIIVTIVKKYINEQLLKDKSLNFVEVWTKIIWHRDVERMVYAKNKKSALFKKKLKILLNE